MTFSKFYFMQLGPVNSICRCSTYITSLNVHDLVTAVIEARLSQSNVSCCTTSRCCDCYTTVIYFSVTCCYRTVFSKVDSLSQLNFQLAVVVINTDVVVSQISAISTADNINCIVKFLSDYFRLISTLCIITSEFQAIIQSSYFVLSIGVIFVYDTSHAVSTVFTVYTISTLIAFNGKAISTIFTIEADGTIFTVDNNSRAVLTIHTDLTVDAIFTWNTWLAFFTNTDFIR